MERGVLGGFVEFTGGRLCASVLNGFSNSHFLLISSFLCLLTICKSPWMHDMGFNPFMHYGIK